MRQSKQQPGGRFVSEVWSGSQINLTMSSLKYLQSHNYKCCQVSAVQIFVLWTNHHLLRKWGSLKMKGLNMCVCVEKSNMSMNSSGCREFHPLPTKHSLTKFSHRNGRFCQSLCKLHMSSHIWIKKTERGSTAMFYFIYNISSKMVSNHLNIFFLYIFIFITFLGIIISILLLILY